MADMNTVKMENQKTAEYARYLREMRMMRKKYNDDLQAEQVKGEEQVVKLQKEYDTNISTLQNDLARKYIELRQHHQKIYQDEQSRLTQELETLRGSHAEKQTEVLKQNDAAIYKINRDHQEYLEAAEKKFERAKANLNA